MDEENEGCVIATQADWNQAQEAARRAIRRVASVAYFLLKKTDIPAAEVPGKLRALCRDYAPNIICKGSLRGLDRMKQESRRSRLKKDTLRMMEIHDLESMWEQS